MVCVKPWLPKVRTVTTKTNGLVAGVDIAQCNVIRQDLARDGFSVVSKSPLLSKETCQQVARRFSALFKGQFETGVYPDEWHWREGISKDSVTREICNAWKSDRLVASIVLSETLGQTVCNVMGWSSVRIAQDDIIWKPPNQLETTVGFHQDCTYISNQFEPRQDNSVTVWIALDDATEQNGCLEYVVGSHQWDYHIDSQFHGGDLDDFKSRLPVGTKVEYAPVQQGAALFHHQDVWHGSDVNKSTNAHRRALVAHYIRGDVTFRSGDEDSRWGKSSYIYGRYRKYESSVVDEDFFPLVYATPGSRCDRTRWLNGYILA